MVWRNSAGPNSDSVSNSWLSRPGEKREELMGFKDMLLLRDNLLCDVASTSTSVKNGASLRAFAGPTTQPWPRNGGCRCATGNLPRSM